MDNISRRDFIKYAASTVVAFAVPGCASFGLGEPPPSTLVKRVVRTPDNTYFTYPHSNGFMPDGSFIVASPNGDGLDYISFNPDTGAARMLTHFRGARWYYSISNDGLMLVTQNNGASVIDLTQPGSQPKSIYTLPDWVVAADSDISPDGRTSVLTSNHYVNPADHRLDIVDIGSGAVRTIMRTDWLMDHSHFSPFDPSWVCFCNAEWLQYKRLWLWNEQEAPQGRLVFEQVKSKKQKLNIGHERAMFNKPALLVVAFSEGSTTQTLGLYEVGFDDSVRLVSESSRDSHCNVSRDGRWAVVSLQGTFDPWDSGPANGNWLNTGLGYGFSDVMVVNMRTGERQFLYRGTNATVGQPYEVQPTISPDGRWILLKDAREQKVLTLEIDQQQLDAFLA